MDSGLHFGSDCENFAGESAARPLVVRPSGSIFAPWVGPRREVDCFERVWAECSTFSVSSVFPGIVMVKDAFCLALERRSLTRFAAFPYCARVLREETSASMSDKIAPESADCGLVQAVPRLISTIGSLGSISQ
jgi:hypothetical protein